MPLRKMVDPVVGIIFSLSLLRDNVMKPDVEKENECLSVETYSQYTEQDLDIKHQSLYHKGSK